MTEDERIRAVQAILSDYLKDVAPRHLRSPVSLRKVAQSILKCADGGNPTWRKWEGAREGILQKAAGCWIPIVDLRDYLNGMPGPALTTTDVAQRLRAFELESYAYYPNEVLKDGCEAIYAAERAQGTELSAIVSLLSEHVEDEEQRLRLEGKVRYKRSLAEKREVAEQRLLSGADCTWTQLGKEPTWHCRANGRTYRLTPSSGNRWDLHRVKSPSSEEKGHMVGRYGGRRDATKAVAIVAYQVEPGL